MRIAITGGAGCIGGAIADAAHTRGDEVTIIDRSEEHVFWSSKRRPWAEHLLTDVAAGCPDLTHDAVFHAAAYKHVGLMERMPYQAYRNNVQGTQNVIEATKNRMVLISTDKACGTSLMGRTKWMAERLTLAAGHSAIRLVNVLRSPGSVLDVWERQAAAGEPLTVTDPEASRYWMSAEDAARVCLIVAGMDKGLYAFNPGWPVEIARFAEDFFPGHPINIVGLTPGEAKSERLCGDGETLTKTDEAGIERVTCN